MAGGQEFEIKAYNLEPVLREVFWNGPTRKYLLSKYLAIWPDHLFLCQVLYRAVKSLYCV